MRNLRPITQQKYNEITARIKTLRKLTRQELVAKANQMSPINAITKETTRIDIVYFVLDLEYGRRTLEAYDEKLIEN